MTSVFETERPTDYLERLATSDQGRSYKAVVRSEMALCPGDTVLDLGCGPGTDLTAFAESVGPAGLVIGIDVDPELLGQARRHLAGFAQVRLKQGDIHHLDLPSHSIDVASTDRVLQHVADPARVLDEVRRVLRPGGRAIFAEPDWDTLVIDFPDVAVARAYTSFVSDQVVHNATIGRQLPGRLTRLGFEVRVRPVTSVFLDVRAADQILGLHRVTERAVAAGFLTSATGRRWLDGLAAGPFFAAVTLFVVRATLPA